MISPIPSKQASNPQQASGKSGRGKASGISDGYRVYAANMKDGVVI